VAYTQSEMQMVEAVCAKLNEVVNRQRDYAVKLWEFGQALIELDKKGLPTVLGEEAEAARRMNLRHFNTAAEVRYALPFPKPILGGTPPKDYYTQLEDWLGVTETTKMQRMLALVQKEIEPIWKREGSCQEC